MNPLRYTDLGAGAYEVKFYGRPIGTVGKLRGKWIATLPSGIKLPGTFGARRTAAERLRIFTGEDAAA
jgi:hypothetical protein